MLEKENLEIAFAYREKDAENEALRNEISELHRVIESQEEKIRDNKSKKLLRDKDKMIMKLKREASK